MGDQSHIIELIDQILEETSEKPGLQGKVFDLRDALLQAQQTAQQHAQKINSLEESIEKLKSPAHRIGTVIGSGLNDLYRLNVGGTEYQAAADPGILDKDSLNVGDQVAVNEGYVIIEKLPFPQQGPISRLASRLSDGQWLVTGAGANSESMVTVRQGLDSSSLKEGEDVILDPSQKVILEKLPKRQGKSPVDEDFVPVKWNQVGGQEKVISQVRKVIEYPILHKNILEKLQYKQPKGFLFYGPPGCGKTLIGKAILSDIIGKLKEKGETELEGRFIHVKGPEILNMWLGESERKVREIFKRARDYKEKGHMPFIFIDEAESILGTRNSGRGGNISSTLVPMFCAEMDGIESVTDTVVILATNRPDMIDPAVLRPGRIDRKIKVERPNREDCGDIIKVYLKDELPMDHSNIDDMVTPFLDKLFERSHSQETLVLVMKSGELKKLYWKDFISGAVLEGIVQRAKEKAVERAIKGDPIMIKVEDLIGAMETEFTESSILPTDSSREDWLQLLDVDAHKVARVRRPGDTDQSATATMQRSII